MPCSGFRHSRNAYSGLVPMSPNTTPRAVRTSFGLASLRVSATAAAGERACMGRALYSVGRALARPRRGVGLKPDLQRYSTTDANQRASRPPRPAPSSVIAIRRTCPELSEPNSAALCTISVSHHSRIGQPPGERERERDTGDHARDDEQQRATPAARQGLQILLQLLLDALACFGALRIVDRIDLREELRVERIVQRQSRGCAAQAAIE